jgi:DNA-binding transcriptional MerR regulator
MNNETYSGHSAAEIVGITYRQLDYWASTNLIRPSAA